MSLIPFLRSIYSSEAVETLFSSLAVLLYRRKPGSARTDKPSVCFLFPSERGSVGDEAMAIALIQKIPQLGGGRVGLISFDSRDTWLEFPLVHEIWNRPTGWPFRWFRFCRILSQFDSLGIIGADVLDGYYSAKRSNERLRLANVAKKMGLRAVLLGFSYRADPEPSSLETLKRIGPSLIVFNRDPVSLARVHTLAQIPAQQAADLAFLLEPNVDTPRVQQLLNWMGSRRRDGAFILGVNCNVQALGKARAGDSDQLISAYIAALTDQARQHPNLHFVLIPHDSRGPKSDEVMAKKIHSGLPPETRARSYLVENTWTAAEIKGAAANLDAAVTGRMHFAIACLGSGTPVGSFEYQDKFGGLYDLFVLRELCLPGLASLDAVQIGRMIESLVVNCARLRSQVARQLPQVQQLSRRNILALTGGMEPSIHSNTTP